MKRAVFWGRDGKRWVGYGRTGKPIYEYFPVQIDRNGYSSFPTNTGVAKQR